MELFLFKNLFGNVKCFKKHPIKKKLFERSENVLIIFLYESMNFLTELIIRLCSEMFSDLTRNPCFIDTSENVELLFLMHFYVFFKLPRTLGNF